MLPWEVYFLGKGAACTSHVHGKQIYYLCNIWGRRRWREVQLVPTPLSSKVSVYTFYSHSPSR